MLNDLLAHIEVKTQELHQHSIYSSIENLSQLRFFMERHCYAVYDFMSLTKFLQNEFAPTNWPWAPPKSPQLARFINEIVLAEESDLDSNHQTLSHFEMYTVAMSAIYADPTLVLKFVTQMQDKAISEALTDLSLPKSARNFMQTTFDLLNTGQPHKVAASFCFGREKIIPHMFQNLVDQLGILKNEAPGFHYYLQRHIEIDGDSHGPLALKMIQTLCGDDPIKWQESQQAALQSIQARIHFWDELLQEMQIHFTPQRGLKPNAPSELSAY